MATVAFICLLLLLCLGQFDHATTETSETESAPVLPPVLPKPIIGGQAIAIQQAPWQLSLQIRDGWKRCRTNKRGRMRCSKKYGSWDHICGASLIGNGWAVTAKHCVEEGIPNGFKSKHVFRVVAGVTYLTETGKESRIQKIFHNKISSWIDDLALLKLTTRIENQPPKIEAIAIPPKDWSFSGQMCDITGWGKTENGYGTVLKGTEVEVKPDDYKDCEIWGKINSTQVCVMDPEELSSDCSGDSGGPLACYKDNTPYLLGATSFGDADCAFGYPMIYARVPHFKAYIESTIAAN